MSVAVTSKYSAVPIIHDSLAKIGTAVPTFSGPGTRTRVNASGLIETYPANLPRLDYNPATLELRGILLEEARTNLLPFSGSIGGEGSPSIYIATNAILSANNATSPAGDQTATLVTVSAADGQFRRAVTGLTPGAVYAASIFLKAGTIDQVMLREPLTGCHVSINLVTGAVTTTQGSPTVIVAAYADEYADDWWRVVLVYTQTGTGAEFTVREDDNVLNGTFYAWGAQFELASTGSPIATSYIPTSAIAVDRGVDTFTVADISGFYGDAHTVFADWITARDYSGAMVWEFNDGTANDRVFLGYNAGGTTLASPIVDGGSVKAIVFTVNVPIDALTQYRSVVAWQAAYLGRSDSGGAVSDATPASLPTVDRLHLGHALGASLLNGWLRNFSYYGEVLSEADMTTLSGGGEITTPPDVEFDFTLDDLEDQTGSLDYARIAYHDPGRNGTVVASSEASGYPADAAQRPDTYERWQPTSLPATWRNEFGGGPIALSYCLIAVHDLGSKECSVRVDFSANGTEWLAASDVHSPEDDSPVLLLFSPQLATYARLYIDALGSPAQVPTIGHIRFGTILSMQRSVYGGHSPITLSRSTEIEQALSKGGNFLGQNIIRRGLVGEASFRHLTPEWYRQNFDPFVREGRQYPYGFAWRPSDFPSEVAYCWNDGDIRPQNMGVRGFMQVAWAMTAHDSE